VSRADSHAHAWSNWPYAGPGPSSDVDALLAALDANAVERALVVAARLPHHPQNNEYVLAAARAHPHRLWAAVEVGAFFAPEAPGGAEDLRRLVDSGPVSAVALFPDPARPGWLTGDEGSAVLAVAAEQGLAVSIAAPPALQAELRAAAGAWPGIPFLMHHAGMVTLGGAGAGDKLAEVLATAQAPNVHVKLSGLHYASENSRTIADYLVRPLVAAYGAERLLWGSDHPSAARRAVSYPHTLEQLRAIIDPTDQPAVFGGNLERLLKR
jgi:L-fuconolactonase